MDPSLETLERIFNTKNNLRNLYILPQYILTYFSNICSFYGSEKLSDTFIFKLINICNLHGLEMLIDTFIFKLELWILKEES